MLNGMSGCPLLFPPILNSVLGYRFRRMSLRPRKSSFPLANAKSIFFTVLRFPSQLPQVLWPLFHLLLKPFLPRKEVFRIRLLPLITYFIKGKTTPEFPSSSP